MLCGLQVRYVPHDVPYRGYQFQVQDSIPLLNHPGTVVIDIGCRGIILPQLKRLE